MNIDGKSVKVTVLSPEETEKILAEQYGNKLSPVNKTKLAQQHQKRAAYRARNAQGQKK